MGQVRRHAPHAVAIASILTLWGCSQSTAPVVEPPPECGGVGGASGGHPAGIIDSIYPLAGRPYGVTINAANTILITRQDLNDVVRGSATNFVFTLSGPVGHDPRSLDISPFGSTAAVANYDDLNVGLFDVAHNAQFISASVESSPMEIRFHPDNTRLYVGTVSSGLYVLTPTLSSTVVPAGKTLNGMAFSPSACKLYVSSQDSAYVAEINTAADTILRIILVGPQPEELAVSPDSSELWVADEILGVQVYDLPSGTFATTIAGTVGAWGLAMSPDGQQLYATLPTAGTIKLISRTGRNVVGTLTAGVPRRVAFEFAGAHAVVADETLGAILIR